MSWMLIYLLFMLPWSSSEEQKMWSLYHTLLAAGWVYIAAKIAQGAGRLLPYRFTLTSYEAVYFLLHYPSPYGGRPLDGTLLHCSPDFPLG